MRLRMGVTYNDTSRLRLDCQEEAVDTETADKALGKLEKTLVGTEGNTKKSAATAKELGFAYQDAHGHILPMTELLPKLADKFAKMPNGPEKTALAMNLFGKAGAALLPTLNKGSKGLADLAKESDRFGLTLTGSNVQAL